MSSIPLGQAESQTQEFKSARIFDKADWTRTVAREVVAFLNTAQGGTLWIGLDEERGVAVRVEDVGDADARKTALWDALLDRVEPRLAAGEVEIAVVAEDTAGARLLEVRVRGCQARGPWAALEGTGRHFVVRAGPRMRPLGRDELAASFQDGQKVAEHTERKVRETWESLVARRSGLQVQGWQGLWVAVAPVVEVQVAGLGSAEVAALFRDPALTDNREHGWNFVNPYRGPLLDGEGLTSVRQDALTVRLTEGGRIALQVALGSLCWKGSPQSLYPYIVMEQPTALLRLAATIYRSHLAAEAADDAVVVGDLALLGIEGWTLGSRWYIGAGIRIQDEGVKPGPHVTRERPFQWRMGDLRDHPDRCAWQMMAWLFRAFGYPETMIPEAFDPVKGLVIPDR